MLESITTQDPLWIAKQIHSFFTTTSYGEKLASSSRWSNFRPDNVSLSEWESILGLDVNNLKHLQLSYLLTNNFIKSCRTPSSSFPYILPECSKFTESEECNLLIAATIHDWGEAVVGDIPEPEKTSTQEFDEMDHLRLLIDEISKQNGNASQADNPQRLLFEAYETVLLDKKGKLGLAFNAIEKWGYMRTAMNAWRKRTSYPELSESFERLAKQVVSRHLSKLEEYSFDYPPIYGYLNHPLTQRFLSEII